MARVLAIVVLVAIAIGFRSTVSSARVASIAEACCCCEAASEEQPTACACCDPVAARTSLPCSCTGTPEEPAPARGMTPPAGAMRLAAPSPTHVVRLLPLARVREFCARDNVRRPALMLDRAHQRAMLGLRTT